MNGRTWLLTLPSRAAALTLLCMDVPRTHAISPCVQAVGAVAITCLTLGDGIIGLYGSLQVLPLYC